MGPLSWQEAIKEELVKQFGEQFAERAMKHLEFVSHYTNYGAPGHMDMALINTLVTLFKRVWEVNS